jgi:hypothetical protein
MKRILILLCVLAVFQAVRAAEPADTLTLQQLRDRLRESPALAGNNHLLYPFAPYQAAPAPRGYRPVYISHYGRHGARYITNAKKYDEIMNLLQAGHDKGALTERGEALYGRYSAVYPFLKGHNGDLTDKGEWQHRNLARRMVEAYPSVFGRKPAVEARASVSPRAIISMMSFCDELHSLRPGLQLSYAADYADLPVTALAADEASGMKDFQTVVQQPSLMAEIGRAIQEIGFDAEAFFLRYFKDMDVVRSCGDPAELASSLGEIATSDQCLDFDGSLGDLFTEEELFQFWERSNIWGALMFIDNPYTKGLIAARAWTLLRDILDKADEDLASGSMQLRLRFGHDTVVGPLMVLLGIDGWQPLPEDVTRWKYHFQSWKIPMASNVQFVFYRGRRGDILVRTMYNEQDQILPLPDQSLAPYYHWEDFKAYYSAVCEKAQALLEEFRAGLSS